MQVDTYLGWYDVKLIRFCTAHKALIELSALLIIFYPLVPLAAYINLLWKRPKDPNRSRYKTAFREAEYLAMIAHSIAGGIESPLQFILQASVQKNYRSELTHPDTVHHTRSG